MSEKYGFYEVYSYGDRLRPGDKLTIEHTVSNRDDGTQVSQWTHKSADELEVLRDASAAAEQAVFEKLCGAVREWEEQAAHTMLLNAAIDYVKTEPVKHTSNEWIATDYGFECSNMVYRMHYQIYEDTKYNHTTKAQETVAWQVSWDLHYNFPQHNRGGGKIAGQERKRFASKEKMDNYIIGRIAAHADYFTEISPPVPQNMAWKFSCNGQLLPGYTVEGEKPAAIDLGDTGTDYSKLIRKKLQKSTSPKSTTRAR